MSNVYQYSPELLKLLTDTIPLLCRSKQDVLNFFTSAGVEEVILKDLAKRVREDRDNISKYEIAETVLIRLNEKGDAALRQRREILKRVTEREDFSTLWPNDQLKARGLVAQIRQEVNAKDTLTKINLEREAERKQRLSEDQAKREEERRRKNDLSLIKRDLFALFSETDPHKRGKASEGVLNRLFKVSDILIREDFKLVGSEGEGIVEQIDGVVEIKGHLYLVEMKWWNKPLGVPEVSEHLVRIYHRGQARGIFISESGYARSAVTTCKEALQKTVVVLCELQEIVLLLEQEKTLKEFLETKIHAAQVEKNPLYYPLR